MSDATAPARPRRRRRADAAAPVRAADYRRLRNPFPLMSVFSDDEARSMHETALRTLEELGMLVLLPAARDLYAQAGARVDGEMVFLGREIVAAALATAPRSIHCHGGSPGRDLVLELGALAFQPGAGAPHATDRRRGRRPGSGRDYVEYTRLGHHFDMLHMMSPSVEPQDVPTAVRHLFTTATQLAHTDKLPFLFARGTPQTRDNLEMLRLARGLSEDELNEGVHAYTIINTNSPRTLDVPMAQGLIDFARAGQMSIVTPFTLMGAMAPITVAGAITLSHAECLAAITLTQLARPGAPVCYGTFTSNVDMRSGAPAFGTPAHFQASLAAGQMARLTGLPWRSAAGSASNVNDAQAAGETQLGLWGCLLGGATVIIHAAGWLEGGLTVSYEKIVTDVEILNMVGELCAGARAGAADIGFAEALSQVAPQGHFFDTPQTMARYSTEFYAPIVHETANHGTWTERGAQDASMRATRVWEAVLDAPPEPILPPDRLEAIQAFRARREAEGGAEPES
ncbi:MAG: trimethylamine methyltransferase family protein [Paracoccaceae bacterium]